MFDARKQWTRDGAFSAAAWIAARTDTRRTTCSTEFPGCTAPWEWTEAHHLNGWANTHQTNLGDLALGCHGHHHLLHQPGWTMTRNPDLTITVTRPDGTTLTDPHASNR